MYKTNEPHDHDNVGRAAISTEVIMVRTQSGMCHRKS